MKAQRDELFLLGDRSYIEDEAPRIEMSDETSQKCPKLMWITLYKSPQPFFSYALWLLIIILPSLSIVTLESAC